MNKNKCKDCESELDDCICAAVTAFFFSTKNIERTYTIPKNRFWYVNPKRILTPWTN